MTPRRLLLSLTVVAATVAATTAVAASPAVAAPPVPNSIASLGDSITRGFNACGFYVDCASRSYATGSESAVDSQYLRIRAVNPAIDGHAYNDAKTGAKVADLPGQVDQAVGQGAGYVTILIGANDACTSSEASMTAVATYRSQVDTALARLKSGLPSSQVLIISVPDIKRLWEVGKDDLLARTAWGLFGICQSLLANPTSTATADVQRRDRVRQRVIDFNTQLAQACAAYGANCKFDGNAVFNYRFSLSEISGWDYFHPDVDGQRALAQASYAAGFGW